MAKSLNKTVLEKARKLASQGHEYLADLLEMREVSGDDYEIDAIDQEILYTIRGVRNDDA